MGVKVLDPRNGTLLELVQLCRVSRVVTIDTALVHLCAAAGQRADLLLNAFPDEHWKNYSSRRTTTANSFNRGVHLSSALGQPLCPH